LPEGRYLKMTVQDQNKPEDTITVKMHVSVWSMSRVYRAIAELAITHGHAEYQFDGQRKWYHLTHRGTFTVVTGMGRRKEVVTRVREMLPGARIAY
jgi:hypothetical protein